MLFFFSSGCGWVVIIRLFSCDWWFVVVGLLSFFSPLQLKNKELVALFCFIFGTGMQT